MHAAIPDDRACHWRLIGPPLGAMLRGHQLTIVVFVVIAAASGGCGSDPKSGSAPTALRTTATATQTAKAPKRHPRRASRHPRRVGSKTSRPSVIVKPGQSKLTQVEVARLRHALERRSRLAMSRLSVSQRIRVARKAAPVVLTVAGFPHVRVQIVPPAEAIKITIARADACNGRLGDEKRMVLQLKHQLAFLREVTVVVAGTGQSLSVYVGMRCKVLELPPTKGRIVFAKTGTGFLTTEPFTIRSKRWTIDYKNSGTYFNAFVVKNDKVQQRPISSRKRNVGSMTFRGPGTFRLQIAGSDWEVRVAVPTANRK